MWFNPDLKSRNYFVPGVICNLIMVVTVMLTAMAIVREKEIGTMEQLMVTPIRPMELMIGKMMPAALVGMMDLVLMTTAALLIFGIPFRGNPLVLVLSAALFLLTSLGMGLFISTIANTQQQAIMSSSLIAIPTFMLSGFAYPIRNMPIAVQYFTYLNPAALPDRDRARYLPEGHRHSGTVAADAHPAGLRHGRDGTEREQFPEEIGLGID